MLWRGQFNAIMVLIFFAGIGLSMLTGNWDWAVTLGLLVLLIKLLAGFLNIIFKALLGFPLIYDVKILGNKTNGNTNEERMS